MIEKLQYISQQNIRKSHIEAIKQALDAGAKWIQLRVKLLPASQVLKKAIEAKKLCSAYKARLIVNDYPYIAKETEADGLHLGLTDMSIPEARTIVGNKTIIGGTANTFPHILLRVNEGADYIGLGPYRFTTTKENLSPILGLEGYRDIMKKVKEASLQIPIIAIGGIKPEDIPSIKGAGLYGVAMSGALTDVQNASEVIKKINNLLN